MSRWVAHVHRISGVALALFLPLHFWALGNALQLDSFFTQPQFTFVDPTPTRLEGALLSVDDRKRVRIFATPVQEVPLTLLDRLGQNDILFLDTSHIAKTGSDVTFELFEILRKPLAQQGPLTATQNPTGEPRLSPALGVVLCQGHQIPRTTPLQPVPRRRPSRLRHPGEGTIW
jgi:hypothetical protein